MPRSIKRYYLNYKQSSYRIPRPKLKRIKKKGRAIRSKIGNVLTNNRQRMKRIGGYFPSYKGKLMKRTDKALQSIINIRVSNYHR